jgi:hypothetical protein
MGIPSSSELKKVATEATVTFIYFLLAVAGSAIAYSVEAANQSKLAMPLAFLLVALFSWAYSFFTGCKSLKFTISVMNWHTYGIFLGELIQNSEGNLSVNEMSLMKDEYPDNIDKVIHLMVECTKKSSAYQGEQFRTIILGAIAFILWRATEFIIKALSL